MKKQKQKHKLKLKEKEKLIVGILIAIAFFFVFAILKSASNEDVEGSLFTSLVKNSVVINQFSVTPKPPAEGTPSYGPILSVNTPLLVSWDVSSSAGIKSVTLLRKDNRTFTPVVKTNSAHVKDGAYEILTYKPVKGQNIFRLKACSDEKGKKCKIQDVKLTVSENPQDSFIISSFSVKSPSGDTVMAGETMYFSWKIDGQANIDFINFAGMPGLDLAGQDGDADGIMDKVDKTVEKAVYKNTKGKIISGLADENGSMKFVLNVCSKRRCAKKVASIKVKGQKKDATQSGAVTIDSFSANFKDSTNNKSRNILFSWTVNPVEKFRYVELVKIGQNGRAGSPISISNKNKDGDSYMDKYDSSLQNEDFGQTLASGMSVTYELRAYDTAGALVSSQVNLTNPSNNTNPR